MTIFEPVHLGTVLKEVYLKDYKLSVREFALKIGISRQAAYDIINGKSSIKTETALKLEKAFKVPAQYWLDMQTQYEIWEARKNINLDNVQVIAL